MKIHELKSWPESFSRITDCSKRHDFRKDDRGFNAGDWLILREWDRDKQAFTGAVAIATVDHIDRGPDYGIPEGYCVMTVDVDMFHEAGDE